LDEIECVVVGAGVIGLATARALSPSAEIVDSHALMLAFRGEVEAAGATVVLRTPVMSGRVRDDGFELAIGGEEPTAIRYRHAAGLYAPALARAIDGVPRGNNPARLFLLGGLFFAGRSCAVSAPRLPCSGTERLRCVTLPSISRSRRDLARMASGSPRLITRSIRGVPTVSMRRSVLVRVAEPRVAARLCRDPAKDHRTQGTGSRFRRAGAGNS